MTLFRSSVPLPDIPDNLTIPQFMLRELQLPSGRPVRPSNVPLFIEDDTGRGITFEEAHHRTSSLANALSIKWGIKSKDIVCLFSPNHVDYATTIWAVHTLGGIITPANPGYNIEELKYQLSATKARLLVTHSVCLTTARAAARECDLPESSIILLDGPNVSRQRSKSPATLDQLIRFGSSKPENYQAVRFKPGEAKTTLAFLSFSSGTTGKPKAVAIPHFSVIANVVQMAAHFHALGPPQPNNLFLPGDVVLGVLPFFHIYGLVVIMHFTLFCGASIVVVPKFNFTEFLNSITRHRVTSLFVVPPQIVLLCKHPAVKGRDFGRVKFVISGAAPLGGDLMVQATKVFPNAAIGQGYGATETCTSVAMLQPNRKLGTIGSAGELLPGIVAKIVKADLTLAKEGESGELVVTGPSMALEYHGNEAATAETFDHGWVRTGDEAVINKNNEVFIIDRLKEIMKVRGFQVAPAELEGHLLLHHHVADVCIVGVPDEYSGEVPLAYVVPTAAAIKQIEAGEDGAQAVKKAIEKYVADTKIQYKWLAGGVEFIDAIPKNPSGKILRRILREKAKATVKQKPLAARL